MRQTFFDTFGSEPPRKRWNGLGQPDRPRQNADQQPQPEHTMNRTMLLLLAALCSHGAILFSPTRSHGACPPPGSYSVTFNLGTTYFANHLDNPPLDFSTLPTPPGPVTVYKYTGIGFDPYVYDPDLGGWS